MPVALQNVILGLDFNNSRPGDADQDLAGFISQEIAAGNVPNIQGDS